MSEEKPEGAPAPEGKPEGEPTTTFTQQQVNDLIAREKGKIQARYEGIDLKQLKADADELARIKEEGASELEKAQGKLTKAERERDDAKAALLRFEVAAEKEVPGDALDLLSGKTREELEASADKILNLVKSRNESDQRPDFDGGARASAPDPLSPEDSHQKDVLALLGLST